MFAEILFFLALCKHTPVGEDVDGCDVILKFLFAVICRLSPQRHHSRTVLPSNGDASSRHANRDAVDRRKGGVGGERSVDISAASNSLHRDVTADMISYQTHSIYSGDINKLSEQTATACTVQEIRGETMSSQQPISDGADRDKFNLRSDQTTLQM